MPARWAWGARRTPIPQGHQLGAEKMGRGTNLLRTGMLVDSKQSLISLAMFAT